MKKKKACSDPGAAMDPTGPETSHETVRTAKSDADSVSAATAGTTSHANNDVFQSAKAPSTRSSLVAPSIGLDARAASDADVVKLGSDVVTVSQPRPASGLAASCPVSLGHQVEECFPKKESAEPAPSRVPSTTLLSLKYKICHSPVKTIAFVAAAVTAALAIVFALSVRFRREEGRRTNDEPFCCPERARHLARYVDRSLEPCADFARYVCSSGFRRDADQRPFNEYVAVERDVILGTTLHSDEYARFLGDLFRSCLRTLEHPRLLADELALGLIGTTGLKQAMTAGEVLNFFLVVSLKFSINTLLTVRKIDGEHGKLSSIQLVPYDIRLNDSQLEFFDFGLDTIVDRFNGKLNTTASPAQVVSIDTQLRGQYPSELHPSKLPIDEIGRLLPSYSRDRWVKDMTHFGWPEVASVTELLVYGTVYVSTIFKTLLNTKNWPAAFAYLLAYTAAGAYSDFDVSPQKAPPSSASNACLRATVDNMPNAWQFTYARIFSSHEKNARVNATFHAVLSAVIADVEESTLSPDKISVARNVLLGAVLIPPPTHLVLPDTTGVFANADRFGLAYYSALDHEFQLTRALTLLGLPRGIDAQRPASMFGHRVIPSAAFYPFLDFDGPAATARIDNMAVMGTSFAQLLWTAVKKSFLNHSWGAEAFSKLSTCMSFPADGIKDDVTVADKATSVVSRPFDAVRLLSINSVLRAMQGLPQAADWHRPRPSWSDWNLSHAQFFYVRHVFFACFFSGESLTARLLMEDANAALAYVGDFAEAFSCTPDSPTMNKRACLV
ncbi:hypothetical protein V5799_004356 [Amblyomma americanum]|uniref:Uncharacterized protein n=1 Tax=Amblyomma americanum TaxID=6943 RepID=A0AAQ4D6C0_AMBAM